MADPHYLVLRTHSHTDKQQLFKVMSRQLPDIHTANNWKDYVAGEETNNDHEFFVAKILPNDSKSKSVVRLGDDFIEVEDKVHSAIIDMPKHISLLDELDIDHASLEKIRADRTRVRHGMSGVIQSFSEPFATEECKKRVEELLGVSHSIEMVIQLIKCCARDAKDERWIP